MESEARKDFDEALAIRKSCLQILIVIVEFLSNANIRGGMIVIQAKAKEQAQEAAEGKSPTKGSIQQVIPTSISAQDHKKLTNLIYNKYDLLDLIYKQVIMRIIEPNNTADKEKNKSNVPTTSVGPAMNRAQMAGTVAGGMLNQNYLPSAEEIKLGARAFASMPFSIL